MAKSEDTIRLEKFIQSTTSKVGTFGCFEVTIGFGGKERVDYMTYDTNGIFRCYEIKVSKSDFNSDAKVSFVGHYNYYVLTYELYEFVKHLIPKEVGIYTIGGCMRKAKRNINKVDINTLKDSMIRSLYRDSQKLYKIDDYDLITRLNSKVSTLESKLAKEQRDRQQFENAVYYKYGREEVRNLWDSAKGC